MSLPASVSSDLSKNESVYYDDIASVMEENSSKYVNSEHKARDCRPVPNATPAAITCTIVSKSLNGKCSNVEISKNNTSTPQSPEEEHHFSAEDLTQKV